MRRAAGFVEADRLCAVRGSCISAPPRTDPGACACFRLRPMWSWSAPATPRCARRLRRASTGRRVLVLERAPEAEAGGNSRFTAGAIRFVYDGVDDLKVLMPDLTDDEIAITDFGTYTEDQFFDDMARVTAVPHRSRPGRAAGQAQPRHPALDARQGRALRADLRPAGVQGRRQVQVLGRADGRGLAAAGPAWSTRCTRRAAQERHRRSATRPRALALIARRRRRARRARARTTARPRDVRAAAVVLAARRLRGQRRMAHALSRARLGPRQGARHALQHRRRHPHGARHRRARRTATGRAATRSAGTATRPSSATSPSATASRSTAIRSASWSTPTASASSTKAPTSATTPTPSTAA